MNSQPVWVDDLHFSVGDTHFQIGMDYGAELREGHLRILKDRRLLDTYIHLARDVAPRRVFELGIYRGGSAALMASLSPIERLVAVDIRPRCKPLDEWIARHSDPTMSERVRPYYEVDQSDSARLIEILDDEFGAAELDLIIDDASHDLEPTRATFNTTFPRLREGGTYLIEDWAWVHSIEWLMLTSPEDFDITDEQRAAADDVHTPMSHLILELVLAMAHSDVISDIRLGQNWAEVVRGPGDIDADFDIGNHVVGTARTMLPEA